MRCEYCNKPDHIIGKDECTCKHCPLCKYKAKPFGHLDLHACENPECEIVIFKK